MSERLSIPWSNLGDLVNRQADPNRVALIDLHDATHPRQYTHGDLDRLANAVASGLVARGYQRGARIAILAANRAEYLAAYFGTMRAGMVSVPVNFKVPQDTVEYILRDAEVRMMFTDTARRAACPVDLPVVHFDASGPEGFDGFLVDRPYQVVQPEPDEIAMFLYTSGSTGRPKGVPLSHAGQLWSIAARAGRHADWQTQRLLVAAPMYHMNALATLKFVMAVHASAVLLPQFRAPAYIAAIERYRCTWLTSVPTMIALVAQEAELLARTDLSSVQHVAMGSAPLTQALIDKVKGIFPGAQVTNGYGTTEAGPAVFGPHPQGLPRPDISLGYPLAGLGIRLVQGDNLDAEEGVLQLRTPALMPGYHNLPEKTAAVLTADGYYHTGDVMRRDQQGFYYFVGRADDMFVCNGENVYPAEVEQMLERHSDIQQACVVPVPDEIRGQKPVAFIVPTPGAQLTAQSVKEYALANGPAYQHPRQVEFVTELPLAGTNKIDRQALIQRALAIGKGA
jgi:acyl-CoA synthetase (AMP-forming)/AMP-acid ligase II